MTTRRSVLLLAVCAAAMIPASASACDNSELRLLDIQFSGGTWTVEIEACVGAGILGATTGADANTNDWAIAAFGADPATDITGFSPPSLTSAGSGGTVQGVLVADPAAPPLGDPNSLLVYQQQGPTPFACNTSTAACGPPAMECFPITLEFDSLPDRIQIFGFEGAGNPIAGCSPNPNMQHILACSVDDDCLGGCNVPNGPFPDPGYCEPHPQDATTRVCVCRDCNDGALAPRETCDGALLRGETCASRGFGSGPLGCSPFCSAFDESECVGPCGDARCTGAENAGSCPQDCMPFCTDGFCTHTETNSSCPQDCPPDAGIPVDAGADAGPDAGPDAGTDAGPDAGTDAGPDAGTDAGPDAGTDAGPDAGSNDAGANDAGSLDSGLGSDAGPVDSGLGGDAGAIDAGEDAGPPDAEVSADGGPNPSDAGAFDAGLEETPAGCTCRATGRSSHAPLPAYGLWGLLALAVRRRR